VVQSFPSAARGVAVAALAAVVATAAPAAAQQLCDGRPIREIRVTTTSLFATQERLPGLMQRAANAVHWRTRPGTVARDLLFDPGEPCDPRRLEESERLLRTQGYLRSAEVAVRPAPGGQVDVDVLTQDDWTLDASVGYDPGHERPLRRLRLAEDNLFGRGVRAQARYQHAFREPGFDATVLDRHLLGRREDLTVVAGHSGVGPIGAVLLLRQFESEFDRIAWRVALAHREEPFPLRSSALGLVQQPVVGSGADLGVARRFGEPGRLVLVGLVLGTERQRVGGAALAERFADDSLAAALLAGRWTERRATRLHLILGARSLRFSEAVGLDAVHALEDVREGVEVGIVLARTVGGGAQRDWFTAGEVFFGGWATPRTLLFLRGKLEGRRVSGRDTWEGVLATAQLVGYRRLAEAHVVAFELRGGGGWHTTTPYQILLAGPYGVRGSGRSELPVGRRVLARVEHRYFAGTLFGTADLGLAGFVDLGRGYAGDAVFATNTGTVAAAGGGLRLGLPSGSRRVWRLDLALPVRRGRGAELRLGFGQQFGVTRAEAADIGRSRETISSASVFNFPRY
jgi:hypothetical protein